MYWFLSWMLCFSCVIVKRLFISTLLTRVHLVLFVVSVYQNLLNNTHPHHTLKRKTSLKNLSLRNSLGTAPLVFVRSLPKQRSRDQVTAPDSLLAPKGCTSPFCQETAIQKILGWRCAHQQATPPKLCTHRITFISLQSLHLYSKYNNRVHEQRFLASV